MSGLKEDCFGDTICCAAPFAGVWKTDLFIAESSLLSITSYTVKRPWSLTTHKVYQIYVIESNKKISNERQFDLIKTSPWKFLKMEVT